MDRDLDFDLNQITFHLCDFNNELVEQWMKFFKKNSNFKFYKGNIFEVITDMTEVSAIVSPANSFGFMDGGIDEKYCNFFGWEIQDKLQLHINKKKYGELVVGDAVTIEIPNSKKGIKYLISSPTMRNPSHVQDTINAYLSFRATIIQALKYNIKHVICPGLATGIGGMKPRECAAQMLYAYKSIICPDCY